MRVAAIGAGGFVGRHACAALRAAGHRVVAVVRRPDAPGLEAASEIRRLDDAGPEADWPRVLDGADAVLHLAAPPGAESGEARAEAEYRRVVVEGAAAMARAAAGGPVRRLVFVSSIKANGEATDGAPFAPESVPRPETFYGRAKLEAEARLLAAARDGGPPVTIVRPPAVYGPGGTGNVAALARLLSRAPGRLLPLSGIGNRRALVYVGNLASALARCVEDDSGEDRLFMVHDGAPATTSGLCRAILRALGKPDLLAPDPFGLARAAATALRPELARRLYGSLEIADDGMARAYGWTPPFDMAEGLARTVAAPGGRGAGAPPGKAAAR